MSTFLSMQLLALWNCVMGAGCLKTLWLSTDEPFGALYGLHEAPTRAAASYQQLLPGPLWREMVWWEGRHGHGFLVAQRGTAVAPLCLQLISELLLLSDLFERWPLGFTSYWYQYYKWQKGLQLLIIFLNNSSFDYIKIYINCCP